MNIEPPYRPGDAGEALREAGSPETGGPKGPSLRAIDLVLVLVLTAALTLLIGTSVETAQLTTLSLAALLALQSAIPMAVVYLVVIRARGLSWSDIGFRPISRQWALRAGLIGLATLPAVSLVNLATQALSGREFRNPQLDFLAPAGFSWEGLIGMLLVVGVVAPIVEETIFRGLLYGWLRSRIGVAGGAVVSALAFGSAHGILMLLPALAVTGLVLALTYERSRSLWPAIIVHGTINAIMIVSLYAALAADAAPG